MSGASASAAPPKPGGSVRASTPSEKWRRLRLIPLAAGAGALIAGLWVGLARLGLVLPGGMPALAEFHGALMISGFLGTVISLERAVAIGRWWAYAAPALSAIGAVALIVGAPAFASGAFLLVGIGLTFNSGTVVAHQPALFTVVLTVAAAARYGLGGYAVVANDSNSPDSGCIPRRQSNEQRADFVRLGHRCPVDHPA